MNEMWEINTRDTAIQSPRQQPHIAKEKCDKARNAKMQRSKGDKREEHHISSLTATTSKGNKNKTIEIIGDSMLKRIEGYKMSEATGRQEKIIVESFSGATTDYMNSHAVSTTKRNPKPSSFTAERTIFAAKILPRKSPERS